MQRFFVSLLTAALTFNIALPLAQATTTLSSGDLIKGSSDAVYYYANDGKRWVFPNEKTYTSWYSDFSGVKTVSDAELAAIPLGKNVTYRPGVKLVKVTTNPKVYAVSAKGVLRWVTSETVATGLYGSAWNKNVDDLPDPFFINYTVGADIVNVSDFSPAGQTSAATSINIDQQLQQLDQPVLPTTTSTSPTPSATSTAPFSFTSNRVTAQVNDVITYTADATNMPSVTKIDVFVENSLIKSCTFVTCVAEFKVPMSGTLASYTATAVVTQLTGATATSTVTTPIAYEITDRVKLWVGQSIVMPGQAASAIVAVDSSLLRGRIDILVNQGSVEACYTGRRECRWSDVLTGPIGTTYVVMGMSSDAYGRRYMSKPKTITIGVNDSPGVTVTPAKESIYKGEMLDVTVTAQDTDGITSIDVMDEQGNVLKTCLSAAPCTATTGPWNDVGALTFIGRATDAKNLSATSESPTVTVTTP
jgi:uncharacterized repeat protein (TIGR01451 family)